MIGHGLVGEVSSRQAVDEGDAGPRWQSLIDLGLVGA